MQLLTADFSVNEMRCPCPRCADVPLVPLMRIMIPLQKMRDIRGSPIVVTSGARCKAHNDEIGGAPQSRHVALDAVDILCVAPTLRREFVTLAHQVGIQCIEIAPNHIHLDMRPGLPILILGGDH